MLMAILKTTTRDKKASHDGPVWPTEEGAGNPRPEAVGPIGAILWWNAVVLIMEAATERHSSSSLHGSWLQSRKAVKQRGEDASAMAGRSGQS